MKVKLPLPLLLAVQLVVSLPAQAQRVQLPHEIVRDSDNKVLAWYKPEIPGAAYAKVAGLAAGFLKSVPVEPQSGLKLYMVHADFRGPNQDPGYSQGTSGTNWMANPACVFAGFVQSLAVDYRAFSGDDACLDIVRECLDQMLERGTTPADWLWPNCPYASADPRNRIYQGATKWEDEGRGDGLHCIEPDKVGELGIGYLKFYEIVGDGKYCRAAIDCADALAQNVRDLAADTNRFAQDFPGGSPWPFRVNARTGEVIDDYTSNVVEAVRLFDELLRISDVIDLDSARADAFTRARKIAWDWLFAKNGPMKTYVWNGYFEDIPSDPACQNRVQITPLETARYILKHPEYDPEWKTSVPALLYWVAGAFATDGMDAIKEQTWCYAPMGSHTARYASVCALYYEKTGEERFKEEAFRFFNFATYMCEPNGYVWVGPGWPTAWFSDGYGDYIRHFIEGLGAVPEWAPAGENHLLRSSSVVQKISCGPDSIYYKTFDNRATDVFRLGGRPREITVNGSVLNESTNPAGQGWTWEELDQGGVLRIMRENGSEVKISI
ncbi:MAG: hypothetical protein FVQ81_17175 [Candidatus Glassbacteria bacterium]|nr:hypothetical protein [Candidatus Glassbacteria bacterium]